MRNRERFVQSNQKPVTSNQKISPHPSLSPAGRGWGEGAYLVTGYWFLVTLLVLSPFASAQTPGENQTVTQGADGQATIDMELKGVNVLEVLDFFSKESGLNIVAGRGIEGQVTIFLKGVGVRKALDTVLEAAGLAMTEDEGLIKIITEQEYYNRFGKPYRDRRLLKTFPLHYSKAESLAPLLEAFRTQTGRILIDGRSNTLSVLDTPEVTNDIEMLLAEIDVPSETRSFMLRYIKAQDLEPKIRPLISTDTGSLNVDPVSNRVVVTDTVKRLDQIAKVIEGLDARPPQVLIEARVVQVTLSDNARYGINWDFIFQNVGSLQEINLQPNYSVTAPNGGTLTTLTLGRGIDDVQTVIQMLEQFGKTNTLSSPRIAVVSDQEAKLAVATREPFVTQTTVQGENTSTTADNVQFVDVGVTMNVTPKIGDDDYIVLKIKPQVSTQGDPLELEGVASGSNTRFVRTRVPVVTTQEFETTVVIKDGHTIVIGGLIQDSEQKDMQKFPILGDIPLLGAAFRSKTHDFSKTELVVFLTPRILPGAGHTDEPGLYLNDRGQLLPFDQVGGYPFNKGIYQSQDPFRSNDKPYWQRNTPDDPDYFPPPDLNTKSYDRYAASRKTAPSSSPLPIGERVGVRGRPLSYHEALKSKLLAIFKSPELGLHTKKGTLKLTLIVRRDGTPETILVHPEGLAKDAAVREKIKNAVRAAAPFPAFSIDMKDPRQSFDFEFQFPSS